MMRREELDYMFHQSSVRALSSSIIHSLVQYTFMEALLWVKQGSSHGGKAALSETGASPVKPMSKWRDQGRRGCRQGHQMMRSLENRALNKKPATQEASEVVQWGETLAAESEGLSLIPRTMCGRKELTHLSCPLTSRYVGFLLNHK